MPKNNNNSLNIREWFDIAKRDLKDAEMHLKEGSIEGAGIHLQQAIEKSLKGFLLSKGWKLVKTHNLSLLLEEAVKHLPILKDYEKLCEEVSLYYFEDRYPPYKQKTSSAKVKAQLRQAKKLITALKGKTR